ncbi:MAG: hypothetical protein ACR2IE_04140 [Candidatus Sumerlaeaceae bacterium]
MAVCFVLTLGIAAHMPAIAQLPPAAEIHADLAGPFATTAPKPIMRDANSPWQKRLVPAMHQQARYVCSLLKPWSGDPAALTLTPSKSKEHDIRPNAHLVYGLASLRASITDGYLPGLSRDGCREKAFALLRLILPTHRAGGAKCNDGKQWYDQWQSALWANTAGRGCWLLWDELTPEMRWLAARMICDEADRFIDKIPPSQIENDTKAEENAWNSTVISLAYCMFPNHPHSEQWRTTALRWAVSSFARKSDLNSSAVYDGKTIAEWLAGTGPNIHDDFTLENHHRVHPDYMNTVNILLFQREVYTWAGRPVPQVLDYNTTGVYGTLKKLSLPDGGYIYPNGQDWQLHRNPQWTESHIMQAVLNKDVHASRLLNNGFECVERMRARDDNGGVFLPEEFSFPSTQPFTLEMLALMFHAVGMLGEPVQPVSEETYRASVAGLHPFSAGKFALLRTQNSIASFSWGKQVMGMVMPLDKDLLLSPNERSMIGRIVIQGLKDDPPKIESVRRIESSSTLGVIGKMMRGGNVARQHFAFVALPDGRAVYADHVEVTTSAQVKQIDLGLLAVLNDQHWVYSRAKRQLFYESDSKTFTADGPEITQPVALHSSWYNLDDKLGIGVLQSSGRQTYLENHKIGNGRLEQPFALNSIAIDNTTSAPAISPTVVVFYPARDHTATRQLVSKCKAEPFSLSRPFAVTLDDSTRIRFSFADQQITIE